jgi:hypothetical protein
MLTPNQDRLKRLADVQLEKGTHDDEPSNGECHVCIMEARAWVYEVPHTDHPDFDSPGISAFLIALNDSWPDAERQRLKKYEGIPPTKASVEVEQARAVMCLGWFLREHQPLWLEAAGLSGQAAELRALPAVTEENVEAALVTQKKALQAARAAWDAWSAVSFLIAARGGDALGKAATEQQRIDAGIAVLDAVTAATRDAELGLLDRMIALGSEPGAKGEGAFATAKTRETRR